MRIIYWFIFVIVLDASLAGYFLYLCNFNFDAFTVGIAVFVQIYAVLQINHVEWFLDYGGRYQGYFNVFIIIGALTIFADGFAWHTGLGKLTKYGYCVPKSVSAEKLIAFFDCKS